MLYSIMTLPVLAVLATSSPQTPPQIGDTISGDVKATDGDSLRMGDHRIRLYGIDAPESAQRCEIDDQDAPWTCGRTSRKILQGLTKDVDVSCEVKDFHRDRLVSVCSAGGEDLSYQMVRRGWAVAYERFSMKYVPAEISARRAGIGLWNERVSFEHPHDYRARLREEQRAAHRPQTAPDPNCLIKGNVSGSGKIYHSPGQRDYLATTIDAKRGEQWFCSAADAEAAGWRAAKR